MGRAAIQRADLHHWLQQKTIEQVVLGQKEEGQRFPQGQDSLIPRTLVRGHQLQNWSRFDPFVQNNNMQQANLLDREGVQGSQSHRLITYEIYRITLIIYDHLKL